MLTKMWPNTKTAILKKVLIVMTPQSHMLIDIVHLPLEIGQC